MTHAAVWQVICSKAHERWDIKKIALAHRTGLVAIGEPSVIIAVSSAHRKAALEVMHAVMPAWQAKSFAAQLLQHVCSCTGI
jgi:molybdopterin synthase catalytic subunit